MGFLHAIETSASGLTAERLRMEVIANNIANVNTTRGRQGDPTSGPYRRQRAVFAERLAQRGVAVVRVAEDQDTPLQLKYEPGHPDADAQGYVQYPNVQVVTEMVDLISATRAYQANAAVVTAARDMSFAAMNIGQS